MGIHWYTGTLWHTLAPSESAFNDEAFSRMFRAGSSWRENEKDAWSRLGKLLQLLEDAPELVQQSGAKPFGGNPPELAQECAINA